MKTLCVDLGGSRVKLALMTADSHPQPDVFEVDSRAPLAQTLSLVAQHAAAWGQPDAVSIALPCVVCRGTVIACNGKYTDAVGFDWMRWSQKTFGAPVFLMNDAAAALLGEMRCGNARGFANAALIALGTGLGFACCLDGEVQYAPTGSPRITVYKKPFRDGILEDYVAKRGFLRLYGEITGQDTGPSLTVADLGRMAGEGNPAARETFATIGRMLGEALRELIRKERIECLLLGGQISRSYAYLEPGLRKGLYGTACLRSIAPAAHIGHAAFYGLLARLDNLRPET